MNALLLVLLMLMLSAAIPHAGERPQITLRQDGWLTIDGEPFLAIGMYNAGRLDELAEAGFNVTQSYNATVGGWRPGSPVPPVERTREFLDRTAEHGMYAILGCPREFIRNRDWGTVREWLQELKDHPAILLWEQEEAVARGWIDMDDLAELSRAYKEEDPTRPFMVGDRLKDMDPAESAGMLPDRMMDIGIWWWYPFGGPDPFSDPPKGTPPGRLEPPLWLGQTESTKPLWVGLQAYQEPGKKGYRFPTPDEYRAMAYISLIYGARGLLYFIGSGMAGPDGKGNGILNKPEEASWEYVKSLVSEIRRFEPILTAREPLLPVEMTPGQAAICYTLRKTDDALYLIAANKDNRHTTVRFHIRGIERAKVVELRGNRTLPVRSSFLEDAFKPYEAHIYRLDVISPEE